MLGAYISPLAPAAILLLSAFILPVVLPRLPADRRATQRIRQYGAPIVVGLALLSLLGIRLTPGSDTIGEGLQLISGWNFSTTESVAALMIRADFLTLPFLIVTLLALLAVTLLHADAELTTGKWYLLSNWLGMGAMTCLLFISANGLTLLYATMIFDILIAFQWLRRSQHNLAVGHLFLGILTAAGVAWATLMPTSEAFVSSYLLLGLALWLRLVLLPFWEANLHRAWHTHDRLFYISLSLVVGIYLSIRLLGEPLPSIVYWLVVATMLFAGLLTWLNGVADQSVAEIDRDKRIQVLSWLIITESGLILLAQPVDTGIGAAFAVGLIFSLIALWVTPALGKPKFGEGAWSWPYLPALCATLNLIGLPLWLGWLSRSAIYQSVFRVDNLAIVIIIILAEIFALSGLVQYWLILIQGNEVSGRRSSVGIVAMVPFLTPGLASLVLSAITQTDLPPVSDGLLPSMWVVILLIVVGAVGLGYFRKQILNRLQLPVDFIIELLQLYWLLRWAETFLSLLGKAVLRIRVMLEGQYYLGWAIFIALIGALIMLLG